MSKKKIALKNGVIQEVDDKEVQYEFESPSQFFGNNINLLPMQNAVASARAFYSEKFTNQTSALKEGEAPYVQSLKDPETNTSFQDYLGKKTGVVEADDDIDILDVKPDYIEYKDSKGKKHKKDLYNNLPFNRKSAIKNIPLVKKGDKVSKGSILARTNYTDNNGTLAIGRNALTGLVPYKGWTLDDAIVISEDFAKKLSSEQTYQYNEDESDNVKTSKTHYVSLFPQNFKKDQLDNIDENGVVKPGTILKAGDPIILSTKPRMISSKDNSLGKLSKYLKNTKSDASVTWDHEDDAIVTDVVKGKNGWKVVVDSYSPAKPGDKLVQREGNKGTISKIIPTELMPKTKDGRPLEVLLNPLSIPSRVNAAILYEILLGKVAEKTGKPYKLPSFNGNDSKWFDFVRSELDKNGLNDTEEVFDPESGQYLEKPITVGNMYVQKLHHTGESKLSARGQGVYDSQQQPARGGDEGLNCFTAQTKINTLYGPVSIATICNKKLSIPVLTYDFNNQEWCYKLITDWFVRKANLDEIIHVKFNMNKLKEYSINVTKNHMVYDKNGRKVAIGSLHEGDYLYTYAPELVNISKRYTTKHLYKLAEVNVTLDNNSKKDLIPVKIKSITPYKHNKTDVTSINVYDFTVDTTHAYLASNVLVSNSKRIGALENYSLMSAGAYNVIKDALSLRGQRNDEYWRAVREGRTPELAKKSPFVWDKLLAMLQGAGINTIDKGNGVLRAAPFTDKALESYSPVELTNADIIDMKNMQPVKGGLFDPTTSITNKWSKITLSEPIINPPFENMVASLLGVKKSELYDIMQGKKDLANFGSGANAIKNALASIDPRKMFNDSVKQFKEGPKTHKQKALNRMNYIKGMTRAGIKPEELVITKIPVIPPAFRPFSSMGDTFIPGDVNELYKEVFNVNKAHQELKQELGEEDSKEDTLNLYKAVKALYGTDEPENKKLKQRGVSGFMQKLVGGTSKFSYLQKSVTAKPVDFSGRSVIGVNPELSMDEIGVPYDIAWKIFSPYVQRELSKKGLPLTESVKAIEERSDIAKKALEQVVKERPVLYSRAPSWHKFNTLGGWAKLHNGKNLLINPLTTTGLNADFDGDYQIGHVILAIPKEDA